jgi:hypothetical protein
MSEKGNILVDNSTSQNVMSSWEGVKNPPETKPIGFRLEHNESRDKK